MKKILIGLFSFALLATGVSHADNPHGFLFRYTLQSESYLSSAPLSIGTFDPVDLYVGEQASIELPSDGGMGPFHWEVVEGVLPSGTSIVSGKIIGVPSAPGEFPLVLRVTDGNDETYDTNEFTINVYNQLSSGLKDRDGFVSHSFNHPLLVIGGKKPYTYNVTVGQLPSGLSIVGDQITGTPNLPGYYYSSIRISDQNSKSINVSFVANIRHKLVGNFHLNEGYVGTNYSSDLTATGGVPPYHWELLNGHQLPGGLSLASNGTVSGIPTEPVEKSVQLSVFDKDYVQDAPGVANISIFNMPAVSKEIVGPVRPDIFYSRNLQATGGKPPYSWHYSGDLPPGMHLNSSGLLSGTPTATGTFSPSVSVSDVNSISSSDTQIDIHVYNDLLATHPLSKDGYVGVPLAQEITGSGGKAPYSWSVANMPLWLDLYAPDGLLTGTPTNPGIHSLIIATSDSLGSTVVSNMILSAYDLPEITSTPPDGTIGQTYNFSFDVEGGKHPLYWTLQSGSLPAGLTLSSNGTILGAPNVTGDFSFLVQVADANSMTANQSVTMSIFDSLSIASSEATDAYVDEDYSFQVAVTGGKKPIIFSAAGLPSGLSLDANSGVITGKALVAGVRTIEITAVDGFGNSTSKDISLAAFDNPAIANEPSADLPVGVAYAHDYSTTGGKGSFTWAVESGALPTGITLTGNRLLGTPTSSGTYTFTISATDANGVEALRNSTIIIRDELIATIPSSSFGYVGTNYRLEPSVSGGKSPYVWSASNLPAGVGVNATTGLLVGTPTTAGVKTITLNVTDSQSVTETGEIEFTAYNLPEISNAPLTEYSLGELIEFEYLVSGGAAPFTWSVSGGVLPNGLNLNSSGILSGTTAAPGNYSFFVKVVDANGREATSMASLTVFGAVVATVGTPEDAYLTNAFTHKVSATGGLAPYTITATGLPAGLSIDNEGNITGTPTEVGSKKATITIKDSLKGVATADITIVTYALPFVSNEPINESYIGANFAHTYTVSNGKAPFVWGLSSGSFPSGVSFSTGGLASGKLTTAGDFNFTVRVTDANGKQATKSSTVKVYSGIVANIGTPDEAYVSDPFNHTVTATGGKPPYSFSASNLPAGLSISSAGVISGTPTDAGNQTATVSIEDSIGNNTTAPLALLVRIRPTITNAPSTEATVGALYSHTYDVSNGKGPFTWDRVGGVIPAGLTLSNGGVLSGTPNSSGDYNFTVRVTDANGKQATRGATVKVYTGVVANAGTADDAYLNTAFSHTVTATGGKVPYSFSVSNLPAGLSMSNAGIISGTPTAVGSQNVAITVTDSLGNVGTGAVTISAYALPSISNSPSTDASINVAYSHGYTATGGKAPYTWALSSGVLPTGMTLSSGGQISGTPTSSGNFTFTARVTDANGKQDSKQSTVTVYSVLSANVGTAPDGYLTTAFTHPTSASGGKSPYTFSATGLPAGLSINSSTGQIAGTPTTTGTYAATITVTDSLNRSAAANLSITTYALPSIANAPGTVGTVGYSYAHSYTATGGKAPFSWAIASGSLPSGVSLSSAGVISGNPTAAGTYTFTARVTDANGKQATRQTTVMVNAAVSINVGTTSDGYLSTAFSHSVSAAGGVTPYSYSATGLPSGLSINSTTGQISGTPTASGARTATITVADQNNMTASSNLAFNIYTLPSVVNAPVASRVRNSAYSFTYSASGGKAPYSWDRSSGTLPAGMTLSSSGVLSGTPSTASSYTFTVRVTDANGKQATRSSTMVIEPDEISVTLSSRGTPVDVKSLFTAAQWSASSPKRVVINSGNEIGTNTTSHAVQVSSGWVGDLTIENRGFISGIGGAANSGAGGTALRILGKGNANQRVKIANYGTIRGGGGGGGRGGTGGAGVANTIVREPASGYFTGGATWLDTTNSHLAIYFNYNDLNTGNTVFNGHIPNSLSVTQRVVGAYTYHRGPQRMPTNLGLTPFEFYRTYNSVVATTGGAGGNGGLGQGYGRANGEGTAGLAGGAGAGAGGWGNWGGTWGSAGLTGATGNAGNNGGGFAGTAGGAAGASVVGSTHAEFIVTGTRQGPVN